MIWSERKGMLQVRDEFRCKIGEESGKEDAFCTNVQPCVRHNPCHLEVENAYGCNDIENQETNGSRYIDNAQ